MHDSANFWLVYGESQFKDRYEEAIRRTSLNYQTLRNYTWVARRFDLSRRRDNLSFGHHAEVAALDPPEQEFWLRKAEKYGWSGVFDKKSGAKGKATPVIYAAVANNDGSLYRSTDAGATWKLIPKQPTGVMASHLAFDSTGVLYISYGNGPGPNDVTDGAVWKFQPKQDEFTNITPAAPKGGRPGDPSTRPRLHERRS